MRFRGSTLLKYVLSYILILAVSFAGLYFILSVQLKSEYEKKIKNETALKLSNVSKCFRSGLRIYKPPII